MDTDVSVRPEALPGKTGHQRLELLRIQLHLGAMPIAWSGTLPLMQAASHQPSSMAVVHQHLHAITSAIGKEVSAAQLRHTEVNYDMGERFLGAGSHVH